MSIRNFTFVLTLLSFSSPGAAAVGCGAIIFSSDGLSSDLNCHSGTVAVEIRGNGVVLDLNGYTLGGSIHEAILVTGEDVTIRGPGVIKGFSIGVQGHNADRLTVRDIHLANLNQGVILTGLAGATVVKNSFHDIPGIGISIRGFDDGTTILPSTSNTILKNHFVYNSTSINICGYNATHHRISENVFERVIDYGIQLETGTSHNRVQNNYFYDVDGSGVRLSNASMNLVTSNYFETGRLAMEVHDNNGSTNPSCAQPPSIMVVTGNVLEGNTVLYHRTAVSLGLSLTTRPVVIGNAVDSNKFYDNDYGVWFRQDAWHNQAIGNVYSGTAVPVVDAGTGNVY